MERPILLDSSYLRKEAAKNFLTHQPVYEVAAETSISDLLAQINLAGLALNKLAS